MTSVTTAYDEMKARGFVSAGYYEEQMSAHTSFKIGGPADMLVVPSDADGVSGIVTICKEGDIPCYILGGGTNLLVPECGLRGVVLKISGALCGISEREGVLTCGAGAKLATASKEALARSLSGLEFAYGIPGCVGGGVFMNAGAYGGEIKNVCIDVTALNIASGRREVLSGEQLYFDYRSSVFSAGGRVILEARFKLYPSDAESIKGVMDRNMQQRRLKQPLDLPSAGSVFKRPCGYFAGALIDECGLRGLSVGGAMVSEKHAGFIVNTGTATCDDVLTLIDRVREIVFKEKGVMLEPEIGQLHAI